jgi:hypothetical protein
MLHTDEPLVPALGSFYCIESFRKYSSNDLFVILTDIIFLDRSWSKIQ